MSEQEIITKPKDENILIDVSDDIIASAERRIGNIEKILQISLILW